MKPRTKTILSYAIPIGLGVLIGVGCTAGRYYVYPHYQTTKHINNFISQIAGNTPGKELYISGLKLISDSKSPVECKEDIEGFFHTISEGKISKNEFKPYLNILKSSLMDSCYVQTEEFEPFSKLTQEQRIYQFEKDFLALSASSKEDRPKAIHLALRESFKLPGTSIDPWKCNVTVMTVWEALETKEYRIGNIIDVARDELMNDCR